MLWIPHELRQIRIELRLTQQEVAQRMGLKYADQISHWECGRAVPSLKNFFKLMEIYEAELNNRKY